ncbi:ribonuclease III [Rhodotorula toruloides]|uniref:BY PROTMAP: gi/472583341/gb/EMS20984.1/ ribonuclease III [Rhodosporidium toruloides NP11] gi/647401870/emb/CDR48225.1/ RHTO0S16e03950g1_1 [Rhodosporidium toruloides] n=2 Tax=Rhodotorula toruloides TaxID=5286 RepID=A0A0K3C9D9_RHOTO|nr:ribonuclease III [Rhodotorula toruloides]
MSSTVHANGDASSEPPRRQTFDPFAPLSSSTSTNGRPPFPQPSSPKMPTSSFASHNESPTVSRAAPPSSLYVPSTPSQGGAGIDTPSAAAWGFDNNTPALNRSNSLTVASPAFPPTSPSHIHPSYADSPHAPLLHQSPPEPTEPPKQLHSAIPIAPESAGGGGDMSFSTSTPRSLARTPSPNFGSKSRGGSAQHGHNFSVGTHSLLSSRQLSGTSRLAQSLDTPSCWLALYFAFNLGLTLFNKLVLQGFPFPWTLTAIQMLSGTIGTQVLLQRGVFTQARLTTKENGIMVMFSGLYTINIAVSNLSLHLVSVPFHQVVRAMTPLFTILITMVFFRKRHSRQTYLSLLPVVAGVAFATYGDYSFTAWGFILTLLGTLLAALKTIITNRVQVGRLKLHPLDLLVRMSPLAFMQCVFFGWWSGELDRVRVYGATEMTRHKAIALAVNGAIAFGLNIVSFTANKKTSALTMTVAANVKQVLVIVLAVLIFNVSLNPTNLFGISLTLIGGAWYAKVELNEKNARAAAAAAQNNLSPMPASNEKLG